jgi:hypothetical protein
MMISGGDLVGVQVTKPWGEEGDAVEITRHPHSPLRHDALEAP